MTQSRSKTAALSLAFLALTAACAAAPPAAQTTTAPATPRSTPYWLNPGLFSSPQAAVAALDSPDILMRRCGVEWLGRWMATAGASETDSKNRVWLHIQVPLVSALSRAVREMPDEDSQQAAHLLALMGPAAQASIPAICQAIAGKRQDDWVGRADLTTCLTILCGGTEGVPPQLIRLLHNKDAAVRRNAASVLAFRSDLVANRRLGGYDDLYLPGEERRQRDLAYNRQVIPALAAGVDDPVTSVRLAAAHTLERLTYASAEAPWQKALPSLARALSSSDPALRQTAAQALAFAPADLSPVVPLLRGAVHSGDTITCSYAVTALYHATWSDPARTLNGFLPDLASPDVRRRRLAAADADRAARALWNGSRQPGWEPLLTEDGRYLDNVATSRIMGWCLDVDEGVPTSQRPALAAQRLAAGDAAKPRLLAALVQAASDPDHTVRADAASSLDQIGKWTDGMLGRGFWPNPGVEARPQVEKALSQASDALRTTEPALSKRLSDLNKRIQTPHDTA